MKEESQSEAASSDLLLVSDDQAALTLPRIHRYTSILRPLDPSWPSNKAVLALMPLAAVAGLAWSWLGGSTFGNAAVAALVAAFAVFGTWALARELLPDDHAAAFVSMALGFLAALAFGTPGLLLLFGTLGLVRIVNRSTGLLPRTSDSILVSLLVIAGIYASARPWFGAVAALAFFLDGLLKRPVKQQWLFALICFGSMVVYMVDHDVVWWQFFRPDTLLEWLSVLALLLLILNLAGLKKVHAKGDVGNARLEVERVKAGMVIGILATLQGLDAMPQGILLAASIGGLAIGITFRRAFRKPTKGLRAS